MNFTKEIPSQSDIHEMLLHEQELLAFFKNSYGNDYLGDDHFLENYLRQASAFLENREEGEIKSAALLRSGRLTAVATSPDTARFGPRIDNMIGLLAAAQTIEPDAWITILDGSRGMEHAAAAAGMTRLKDRQHLIDRLARFGELAEHTITEDEQGLRLSLTGSAHGSQYSQYAWGWLD